MKRIGFVISSSKPGGTEIALLRTLRDLKRDRFEPIVCVTGEHGSLHKQLEDLAKFTDDPTDARIDVLNIYNNLDWAAAFWERAGPGPTIYGWPTQVLQHVYMHAATLFWHHAAAKSYYALLRNFFRHRYVVCDSLATAESIRQDVALLLNTHPEDYTGATRQRDKRGTRLIQIIRHPREPASPRGIELSGRCLWVGAATWVKGFDRLAQLIDCNPKAQFDVVLKTPPDETTSPELQAAYTAIEKKPNVCIHAAMLPEDLAALRADCDVYLSTSRREGQSLAWDEAANAGLLCLDAAGPATVPARIAVQDVAKLWEGGLR